MSARHPRRWKGHCMACSAWIRGDGMGQRAKVSDLRRMGGKLHRVARKGSAE